VSSPGAPDTVTSTGPAARPAAVSASRPHDRRDPVARIGPEDIMTPPLAGQPGHGSTAFLRNQPARIADGRVQGGYTDVYELICPGCGDHPDLDYSQVSPRLQWLRGPRTLAAGLAAYHEHLGLAWPNEDSAGSLGPGAREHNHDARVGGRTRQRPKRTRAGQTQARQGGKAHRHGPPNALDEPNPVSSISTISTLGASRPAQSPCPSWARTIGATAVTRNAHPAQLARSRPLPGSTKRRPELISKAATPSAEVARQAGKRTRT
jgi:hypothetical protein